MNIPNKLSVTRLFIALTILGCFIGLNIQQKYIKEYGQAITLLFAIGLCTDILDGFIARKYDQGTQFGEFIDPIADKLLINITMLTIYSVFASRISWTVYGLIFVLSIMISISRDTIVNFGRILAAKKGFSTPANMSGKLKTTTQMLAILILSTTIWNPIELLFQWGFILLIISTLFSIISGAIIIKQIKRFL